MPVEGMPGRVNSVDDGVEWVNVQFTVTEHGSSREPEDAHGVVLIIELFWPVEYVVLGKVKSSIVFVLILVKMSLLLISLSNTAIRYLRR